MIASSLLISPKLSFQALLNAGADRVLDVYLHDEPGSAAVGGGGRPQTITTQALPSSWRSVLLGAFRELSEWINLRFRLVTQPTQAELALYADMEIDLGDPSGITFGLAVSNADSRTGRSWWEIFLNAPQLQSSSPEFVSYVLHHELGHVLGMEHPFDNSDGDFYLSTNPEQSAFPEQTVMAYRQPQSGVWPRNYSARDLVALQEVWGAAPRADQLTSVFRLYNPSTGLRLWSANSTEIDLVTGQGFVNEGLAYRTTAVESQAVYRFAQTATGNHFFTASDTERDALLTNPSVGYLYEGVAFQVYSSEAPPLNTSPVLRFTDPSTGGRFYTASQAEQQFLQTSMPHWVNEGVAWYV